jgi:lipopolysaccharide assembly outer membrane protein LptD (OstA)
LTLKEECATFSAMKRVCSIIGIILFTLLVAWAQEDKPAEEGTGTLEKKVTKTEAERVKEPQKKEAEEFEETSYSAKKIEYIIEDSLILLCDSARATYKNLTVTAETIEYHVSTKVVKAYGNPFLVDNEDTISGDVMVYNIETKQGMVTVGSTKIEKGFFTGDTIYKVGEKTLNVKDGEFTTCETDPAHYSFYAKRMKVYSDDMVICEPVILKIQNIPLFFVPFWFFPIKKGRHSGFLFPKVGKGSEEGRYLRNLSFFWATNDYSDITFTFDIFEKKGIRTFLDSRYLVTPFLSGNISGSYINDTYLKSKRWSFLMNHKQTVADRTMLTAHADFLSDEDYNVDYDEEEIVQLNKEIESYISVARSWSGASVNLLVNERRDLAKKTISRKLPRVNFSLSSRRIIPVPKDASAKWYNQAYVSYASSFINKSFINQEVDTSVRHYGMANNVKLQAPQKILSYFSISPSVQAWANVYDYDAYGNRYPVRTMYSTSVALSTAIYGISKGGVWKFEKLRHVIKPSVSYNYTPEEEDPAKYYALEGMGVTGARKNISFSLANLFQTKMQWRGKERKMNLLNITTSTSYDFKKDENPLSNIGNTIEFEPISNFSMRANLSHDPYTWELKNFTVNTSLRLRGSMAVEREDMIEPGSGEPEKAWSVNITHNYVKGIGENIDSQQLFGGIQTWITKNWQIGYDTRYDFTKKELINQRLSIYRDLHCWEAQFSWNSYGGRWKYDFTIKIKKIPEIKVTKGVFGIFIP